MDKVWLIDLVIDGERVLELFDERTADLARALATNPEQVERLAKETIAQKKEGGQQ